MVAAFSQIFSLVNEVVDENISCDQQLSGKKIKEIEKNRMNVEELMNEDEVLGGEPPFEDLRVTGSD